MHLIQSAVLMLYRQERLPRGALMMYRTGNLRHFFAFARAGVFPVEEHPPLRLFDFSRQISARTEI
jgi:hypothetical protein